MAKVAEYKKKIVNDLINLINHYRIVSVINMENLPAPQLQKMRAELRGRVVITMTKRRLIRIAFKEAEKTKKGIDRLEQYLEGMPALIFTNENPFKLYRILQKSKSQAPAKPNQTAPRDIVIPAGPTSFSPGPIIGELAQANIKAGVEGGRVVIKNDSVVAKKGDKISAKVAEILTRLGIEPMEVGLDLIAAYENGTIYTKDILSIDEKEFMGKLRLVAAGAFNVAMFIAYPTQKTIKPLISKAANDAMALGLSRNIVDEGIVELLIGKAEMGMLNLKSIANVQVPEKPKKGRKIEDKQEKAEVKELPKEEKPSVTKLKAIEKKEEEILEEEKEIIEEEEKLEKQKPVETPIEKEVQKAVKEEEEKQLEKERIEKEKEFEKLEQQKAEAKKEETKPEEIKVDETNKKVAEMVAKIKKFGKEPTAEQIVEEVTAYTRKEPKEVPTIQELMKRKVQVKNKSEIETAEQLFEKLKKRGTLRE